MMTELRAGGYKGTLLHVVPTGDPDGSGLLVTKEDFVGYVEDLNSDENTPRTEA